MRLGAIVTLLRVDIPGLLGASELFEHFQPEALEAIAAESRLVAFDRNHRIFGEGDAAEELYVVHTGRVAIANRSPDGRESVMALMEAGDLFGDMSLFDGLGRSAEARALEPSQLVRVPYPAVRSQFERHPELLWAVVAFLSRRLRATDSALADAMFLDVTGRTAKRLLALADGDDYFRMPLTQEELAGMVGASRERVNKAIALFVKLGWLEISGRSQYHIIDRPELEARAIS